MPDPTLHPKVLRALKMTSTGDETTLADTLSDAAICVLYLRWCELTRTAPADLPSVAEDHRRTFTGWATK